MSKKQKKVLARIILSALLAAAGFFTQDLSAFGIEGLLGIAFFSAAYIVVGWDVVFDALRNIISGRVFDEKLLMTLATAGAFAIGEYPEAAAVMLFYQTGEL
ncbi:MAG: heavy metal translocating P-type ATPase, partial [Oscillospiraceae bacterium]|nr:heavy metal translocating P-type ATPase [Oscillospiraceae bacterium]